MRIDDATDETTVSKYALIDRFRADIWSYKKSSWQDPKDPLFV